MGKLIHEDKYPDIRRLDAAGWKHQQIADNLNMSRSAVTRYLQRVALEFPEMPVYSQVPIVEGDAIVVGDVQIPTTDYEFAAKVPLVADRWNISTLLIVGDLLNVDAFSNFPITEKLAAFKKELVTARALLDSWSDSFDTIHYLMGNHEKRFFRWAKGEMDAELLGMLIGSDKLLTYNETRAIIRSNGVEWRATHQDGYSVHTAKVGRDLALAHQSNMITHHEHHVGTARDRYNRYTVISNGGLHDVNTMHYAQQYDSARPTMTQSFAMVRDGVGHLLTPYDTMTDWDFYLG